MTILRYGVANLAKPNRVALRGVYTEILLALLLLIVEVLEFKNVTFALVLALDFAKLEPVQAHDFGDQLVRSLSVVTQQTQIRHHAVDRLPIVRAEYTSLFAYVQRPVDRAPDSAIAFLLFLVFFEFLKLPKVEITVASVNAHGN